MIECKICSKTYKNNQSLSVHLKKCHNITSKEYYDIFLLIDEENKCPCGKYTSFVSISKGYSKHCSTKCSSLDKEVKIKKKKTCIKKYGNEYPTKTTDVKNKIKNTYINVFGVDNPNKTEIIRNKIKNTCIERYGKETNLQFDTTIKKAFSYKSISKSVTKRLKSVLEKRKNKYYHYKSLVKNNGFSFLSTLKEYQDNYNIWYDFEFSCGKGHITKTSNSNWDKGYRCGKCRISKMEEELFLYIKSIFSKNILRNDRNIIKPFELDIVIPDINIAIEFNGLIWHSEKFNKDKHYHLNKTKKCLEKGYLLVHIFEDEWTNNNNYIKKILDYHINKSEFDCNKHSVSKFPNLLLECPNVEPQIHIIIENYKVWDCGHVI